MSDSVERFHRRKQLLKEKGSVKDELLVANDLLVNQFLSSEVDNDLLDKIDNDLKEHYSFEFNPEVSDSEVKELLSILEEEFDGQKFRSLITSCKHNILSSISTPFGIGKIVSGLDKNGGNVDTIYNVREGVYATENESQIYNQRDEYDSEKYHKNEKYIQKNKQDSNKQDANILEDAYRDEKLRINDNRDLDHTISAKEIHDDAGRILSELDGVDLANADSNLNSTDRSINRSKKAKSVDEYSEYINNTRKDRQNRIQELSSRSKLTDKELNELNKLNKLEDIDPNKISEVDQKAREDYNKKINKKYYTSKKFIKNVGVSGIKEGSKMGTQQALGLVVYEFFQAVFDEVSDIYHNGYSSNFEDSRFFHVLKERLQRIAKRIASKWKNVVVAFRDGFISGFLSNLVTVIINMFVRTGKRIVRIIREGFFSLLRAIKLICFPPPGMTFREAAHEASKLIASGVIIAGGIMVEQAIDNMIKAAPLLEPFADILTSIIVGGLTGIITTFVVFAIDKIDFLGVNDKQKHEYIMEKLENDIERLIAKGEELIEDSELYALTE